MNTSDTTLVGDIGGTNTRVALAKNGTLIAETVTRYRNADHQGLDAILRAYLAGHDVPHCRGACVAVAGPVKGGTGHLTNLDWEISETALREITQASDVAVFNDLQAQGYGIDHLAPGSVKQLVAAKQSDETAANATKLVIGIGTGFNIAPVYETPAGRFVPPAEAGHSSLPTRTKSQRGFAQYIEKRSGFAAIETLLSGRGLEAVYAWLSDDPTQTTPAATIMEKLESGNDPVARDAAEIFVEMLGTVAGDLALIHLPYGGIYLVGGVARAVVPYLDQFGFAQHFQAKGRFEEFMADFAIHNIDDDYAALIGCARYLAGAQRK